MRAGQELPLELVCAVCHKPIQPDQDRLMVQTHYYHSRCYERQYDAQD